MKLNKCLGCMESFRGYPCPRCGFDPKDVKGAEYALPLETILAGKYLVGRVLGQGGFGITYIGWDIALERKVAIKEYFPSGQVSRSPSTRELTWYTSERSQQAKQDGMQMFLKEARKMSKTDSIPGVVRVLDLFQENNTAYIIMEFVEGETLKARLQKTGPLPWAEAKEIFLPAIRTMERVHKAGLVHRDLSPDNLMLTPEGRVMILDLGAAKDLRVNSGLSSMQVAKSGFSPWEQYLQQGGSGPWTDVYSMAATMYYALTGKPLPNAIDRLNQDTISWEEPALKALPAPALNALRKALEIRPESRTRDMETLERGLLAQAGGKGGPAASARSAKAKDPPKTADNRKRIRWIAVAAGAMAVIAVLVCVLVGSKGGKNPSKSASASQQSSVKNEKRPNFDQNSDYSSLLRTSQPESVELLGGEKLKVYWDAENRERCRIYSDQAGNREYIFTAEYDGNGDIISEGYYDGDGYLQRQDTITRASDGTVLRSVTADGTSQVLFRTDYTLDQQNNCTGWVKKNGKGKVILKASRTDNADGTYTIQVENGDGLLLYTDAYSKDGKILSYLGYDKNGLLSSRTDYEYDGDGRMARQLQYNGDGELQYEMRYTYAGDLRVLETSYSYGEETSKRETEYFYGVRDILLNTRTTTGSKIRSHVELTGIGGDRLRSYDITSDPDGDWMDYESWCDWLGNVVLSKSYNEDGTLSYESQSSYDDMGDRTGRVFTSYWGNSYTVTRYDAESNPIESVEYKLDGTKKNWTTYTYAENSRRDDHYDETGLTGYEEHQYDDRGNEVQCDYLSADGQLYRGETTVYDANGEQTGSTSTFYYDDSYTVYEYTGDGKKVSDTTYTLSGKRTEWTTYTYSGNSRKEETYDTTGLKEWAECEYDDQGKELWYKRYSGNGELKDQRELTFDDQGVETGSQSTYYSDNDYTVYIYDQDNNRLSATTYSRSGAKLSWTIYTYTTNASRAETYDKSGLTEREDRQYDDDGKTLWRKTYDGQGKIKSETVYTYDANGDRLGSTDTYYSSDGSKTVTEYDSDYNRTSKKKYDANGKLISSE